MHEDHNGIELTPFVSVVQQTVSGSIGVYTGIASGLRVLIDWKSGIWKGCRYAEFPSSLQFIFNMNPPSLPDQYAEGMKNCKIQAGDLVCVAKAAENHEGGWDGMWRPEMNNAVGRILAVREVGRSGFLLWGIGYYFPFFVLNLVAAKLRARDYYLDRQRTCGINVGDTVRVEKAAFTDEGGWNASWEPEMDEMVGQTFKVADRDGPAGFELTNDGENWWFPYFVLSVVYKADNYIIGHRNSGIKVGDRVKVTRKAYSQEHGWGAKWAMPDMDQLVGQTFPVIEDSGTLGFRLGCPVHDWVVPWFVLEIVHDEALPSDIEKAIQGKFGCYEAATRGLTKAILKETKGMIDDASS